MARPALKVVSAYMLLSAGCGYTPKSPGVLGDLRAVGQEVRSATGHENVTVKLTNGRLLSIGMVNSRFASLAEDGRRESARKIAKTAHQSFRRKGSLVDTVAVCFVVHRRYLLVLSYTDAMDCFTFRPAELRDAAGK